MQHGIAGDKLTLTLRCLERPTLEKGVLFAIAARPFRHHASAPAPLYSYGLISPPVTERSGSSLFPSTHEMGMSDTWHHTRRSNVQNYMPDLRPHADD